MCLIDELGSEIAFAFLADNDHEKIDSDELLSAIERFKDSLSAISTKDHMMLESEKRIDLKQTLKI